MLAIRNRTRKAMEHVAAVVVAFMAAFLLCAVLSRLEACEREVYACDETCEVAAAIRRLQPAAAPARADRLAEIIVGAATESALDPLLLVAVAMRESSFSPAVESLTRRGSAGELGLLQVHPRNGAALALRPEDCDRELSTARCQVVTGARWLAFCRTDCPGSTWRWLVHYGTGRCLPEAAARADRNAAIAASYYARAGGTRW